MAIDNSCFPSVLQITIKQSKMDPFRKGVQHFIGLLGTVMCPVATMLDFLHVRGSAVGVLFQFEDGSYLTRQWLVVHGGMCSTRYKASLDQSKYCGHNFRIGVTITAVDRGIEDSVN